MYGRRSTGGSACSWRSPGARVMRTAVAAIAGAALVLIGGIVMTGVYLRTTGLNARGTPGMMETRIARAARRLAIPRTAREQKNPVPGSAAAIADGMAHFADHCASCHGNDGSGQTEMGRGLYPKSPDMRLPETQALSDGELFYIIDNGVRFTGMPAFGSGTADGRRIHLAPRALRSASSSIDGRRACKAWRP